MCFASIIGTYFSVDSGEMDLCIFFAISSSLCQKSKIERWTPNGDTNCASSIGLDGKGPLPAGQRCRRQWHWLDRFYTFRKGFRRSKLSVPWDQSSGDIVRLRYVSLKISEKVGKKMHSEPSTGTISHLLQTEWQKALYLLRWKLWALIWNTAERRIIQYKIWHWTAPKQIFLIKKEHSFRSLSLN